MLEENGKYPDKGWGSEQRPIILKVKTEERAEQVARVCDHYGWHYIMGMEFKEDITDLKKALKERLTPANVYEDCPCGSGKKYKFCCAKTMKNFDLDEFLKSFSAD